MNKVQLTSEIAYKAEMPKKKAEAALKVLFGNLFCSTFSTLNSGELTV